MNGVGTGAPPNRKLKIWLYWWNFGGFSPHRERFYNGQGKCGMEEETVSLLLCTKCGPDQLMGWA